MADASQVNYISTAYKDTYLCVIIEGLTDCLRQATWLNWCCCKAGGLLCSLDSVFLALLPACCEIVGLDLV